MIEILTISIIAWWLSVGLGFVQYLKWRLNKKRFRPFDCPKCLGFWMALIYTYINYGNWSHAFVWAILTSFTSIVIEKGMARL